MSPEAIVAAEQAGHLDDLLGRSRYPSRGQLTAEHVGQMKRDEVRKAYRDGRLTELLGTDDAA
ncbi:hypothetical protein [Nonomuraea lactucae]|uniref:hypothetical protein n=1 Tax=Nonomuraea lactucae TaxID=2249762 RepID=UPI0013B406B0|nr:hypothetical protein [Nonomuraea lactucae]